MPHALGVLGHDPLEVHVGVWARPGVRLGCKGGWKEEYQL